MTNVSISNITAARPVMSDQEARRRFLRRAERNRQQKRQRILVTPEGARLNLRIATAGERAGAFLLDFMLQILILILGLWAIALIAAQLGFRGWNIAGAIAMLFVFALRNFYFVFFELGRKAATPGKRALGLRVAARNGGRLTANAVFARNMLREMEVLLPLQFLFMGAYGNGWLAIMGLIWSGTFLLLPVLNRDKLRAGDIIAGTWVIHAPKVRLMADISSAAVNDGEADYRFSATQLEAYGIHELHVLENVLRKSSAEVRKEVAGRIREKIGWTSVPGETDSRFLESYYAALRRHLEQKMLFGRKKKDKFDQD